MVENAHSYPMPWHVHVLRFVTGLLGRTAIVSGALFLVLFVFALVVEEGVLPLDDQTASGLDAYLRLGIGIVGLGGGFGAGLLFGCLHEVHRRAVRTVLDGIVGNRTGPLPGPPVAWQRSALDDSGIVLAVISMFGIVVGGIATIAAVVIMLGDPRETAMWWVLGVSSVMLSLGVHGFRTVVRSRPTPAMELWGKGPAPLDQRERRHRVDGGHWARLRRRTHAASLRGDVTAPPLRRLLGLDRAAGLAMTVSTWLLVTVGLVTAGLVLIRKPCRTCDVRRFDDGSEGTLDVALAVTGSLLAAGLVVLVLATLLDAVVVLRLRRTVLDTAADAGAEAPPWSLLRRVLLEESPLQDLTGHLHTLAVLCLALGVTGRLTGDTHPMDAWTTQFDALVTVGGILLAFHCSAWFWKREQTRRENEMLRQRWPA